MPTTTPHSPRDRWEVEREGRKYVVSGERGRALIARAKRWGSPREEKTEAKGRKGRRGVATPGQEKEAAPRARRRDHLSPHCMRT